jgi:hypothetical protein
MPNPALTADLIDIVFAVVAPEQRDAFLSVVAAEPASHPTIGPGLAYRVAREVRGPFVLDLRAEAASGAEVRHCQQQRRKSRVAEA